MSVATRILVVEDELAVRNLTVRSLHREGFSCDMARDGEQALERLAQNDYDAVITDLRMPNKHGHALAVELLSRPNRPAIVVLTGCAEPRLAKDLLARGVDDVMFKPVDYGLLNAKVRTLTDKRRNAVLSGSTSVPVTESHAGANERLRSVSLATFEQRLQSIVWLPPLSSAALETYTVTQDDENDSQAVASIVQRDPALVAELLRLANSNYYNRSGQRIANLGEAVSLLGFRRVGDLAIAFSALGVLSGSVLPWLDVNLTWQRSIAASMAAELLARQAGYDMQGNGVSLCALMHPLGRILLGSLFPREYEVMTKTCIQQNESLQELERQVFPLTHTAAGAHLLSAWGLPPEVHHPLHHVADTFNVLGQLAEPTRTKVELIKLAILVGRLAVGRWNARDRIDLPSVSLLNKLRVVSLIDIVQRVRQDMTTLAANQSLVTCSREESESKRMNTALRYCRLSDGSDHAIDPALLLISSMDFRVEELLGDARVEQHGVMINCLGVPSDRISALVPQPPDSRSVLLVDRPLPDSLKGHGNLLRLPCSYGRLLTACQELAPAELAGPHSRVK